MENQNNQQFKEDEIAYIRRWDKELNDYISNPYPKIGGRLRLAHEDNEVLSIETVMITICPPAEIVIVVTETVAHRGQMLTAGTAPVLTVAMVATVMETAD